MIGVSCSGNQRTACGSRRDAVTWTGTDGDTVMCAGSDGDSVIGTASSTGSGRGPVLRIDSSRVVIRGHSRRDEADFRGAMGSNRDSMIGSICFPLTLNISTITGHTPSSTTCEE